MTIYPGFNFMVVCKAATPFKSVNHSSPWVAAWDLAHSLGLKYEDTFMVTVGKRKRATTISDPYFTYYFKNKDDALRFKLAWL